jgi:hypothetical protein
VETAQKNGVDFQAALIKPFTVDKLLKTVDDVLRHGGPDSPDQEARTGAGRHHYLPAGNEKFGE